VALKDGLLHPAAFEEARHPVLQAFADLARERRTWLLLGSLGVRADDGRIFNRGYLIDPQGAVAARYDKIHMFDVELTQGAPLRESATIAPGDCAVLADTGFCALGLSICYDLRFPHLYRRLAQAGADVLAVPAAFTKVTGEAHWHVLNRARAIENGCYVAAPCQYGTLPGGAACFGHSLIVDPWGTVLADGGEAEGIVLADIDPAEVRRARSRIPALSHDRPFEIRLETGRSVHSKQG
jgi:predicted amidohydrolase